MTQPTAAKRPGPSLALSITVMVVAFAVGAASLVMFVRPFIHTFRDSPRFTASDFSVNLGKGSYQIYARFGDDPVLGLHPNEVTVSAPNDGTLPVSSPSDKETITRSGASFTGAARFHTPHAGNYRIQLRRALPGDVIVARDFRGTFRQALPWLPSMALGGLGFLAGIALLIIGIVRRHARPTQPAYAAYPPPMPPPPGWYPDPEHAGRLRYWDGQAWTEHRN